MTPTFTVLIGSIGRPSLRYTLDSIARQQRVPGDQVIVAIDSFEHGDRPDVQALVRSYGEGFECCAHDAGYHWLGVEQINYALRTMPITGSHIFTLGDDDVFVDAAYATLRPICAAEPLRPVLYRFVAPWRELLWEKPEMEMSRISGCCIAAPRKFVGEMPTRCYVEHDYDWMVAILAASGVAPKWLNRVLVIARPPAFGEGVVHRGIVQCWHCKGWRYREQVDVTTTECPRCHVTIDVPGLPVAPLSSEACR